MGVRFNKRMKILPYVTMNVGKSGITLTIGPKGKTLNIGSTGVNVNVSLGKGMGYSKRLITWKKLNLLSLVGLGGAAAAKKAGKGKSSAKKSTTTVPSLDEAIAEAEASATSQPDEQSGCGPLGCFLGLLAVLIILALIAAVIYLLVTRPEASIAQ